MTDATRPTSPDLLLTLDCLVELVDRVEHARGQALAIGESSAVKAAFHAAGSVGPPTASYTRGVEVDRFYALLATTNPDLAEQFRTHRGRHAVARSRALSGPQAAQQRAIAQQCL
ncbi:hypothetical protein [Gordonia hongkongensis]|uniref:hypothetical protein n=1 Tax=Gordonia hongkongensis TaxID=1701090 RepID=UPI001FF8E4E1|nr:hypothetical protein [Gordonia hongkongensis]UPG70805.1 hypothetical protein MVF96_24255 [Gordonia hongkongensis]